MDLDIENSIAEACFDMVISAQQLIKEGWEFKMGNYGERRLGTSSHMLAIRGDKTVMIWTADDLRKCYE